MGAVPLEAPEDAAELEDDIDLTCELAEKFERLGLEAWHAATEEWLRTTFDHPLLLLGSSSLLFSYAPYLGYKLAWELAPPDADLRLVYREDDKDDPEP